MPERYDANESFTIIEKRIAFGNLNIGVSFVAHRKSGVIMPTTKFGPEVKAGKRASDWERYLRHLVTTWLIFDESCTKTGCLYSTKLPGATALKALIDGHDNPHTANAGISKIIKRYNDEGGTELTVAMSRRQPSPT